MKHLLEAQSDALQSLQDSQVLNGLQKVCLIVDVQGKLHLLALLEDTQPTKPKEANLRQTLEVAAEDFWSGELLLQRTKEHIEGRTNPADEPFFDAVWKEGKPFPPNQSKTFMVERRFSKEQWFDASTKPPWPLHAKTPRIVSFYSYKGGLGRTTALAAVGLQLARQGQRVVLLDFDLEAPGLGSVFPPVQAITPQLGLPDYPVETEEQKRLRLPPLGLLDYLVEFPVLGNRFPLADIFYAYSEPAALAGGEPIQVGWSGMPGEAYLAKLSRLNMHRLLAPSISTAPAENPVRHLLQQVKQDLHPDWILIDSRAGLYDLGGLALSGLAHWHVLLGLDSEQSWAGISVAISRLGKLQVQANQPQLDSLLVQALVSPPPNGESSKARFLARSHKVFSELYYVRPEDDKDDQFYVLEDQDTPEAAHFPVPLAYDTQVMGYQKATEVVERLCEGDFKRLAETLFNRVNNALTP